jgi:hypothetical protein
LIDYDPADIKAARELIDANLKTQLETTTNPNTGQLQFTNPDASGEILNNAVDFYVSEMSDPIKSRSGAEVIKDIFERVDTLTEDPSIDLRDIAENFKTFEIPPPKADLVSFFSGGRYKYTEDEMIDMGFENLTKDFIEHMRAQSVNEVTATKDLNYVRNKDFSYKGKQAFGRLTQAWDSSKEAGTGPLDGIGDFVEGALTAPSISG